MEDKCILLTISVVANVFTLSLHSCWTDAAHNCRNLSYQHPTLQAIKCPPTPAFASNLPTPEKPTVRNLVVIRAICPWDLTKTSPKARCWSIRRAQSQPNTYVAVHHFDRNTSTVTVFSKRSAFSNDHGAMVACGMRQLKAPLFRYGLLLFGRHQARWPVRRLENRWPLLCRRREQILDEHALCAASSQESGKLWGV